jgi:polysaccharide deacetylase 2 family uncharacterized protein YibQ
MESTLNTPNTKLWGGLLLSLAASAAMVVMTLSNDANFSREAYEGGRFVKINVATGVIQGMIVQREKKPEPARIATPAPKNTEPEPAPTEAVQAATPATGAEDVIPAETLNPYPIEQFRREVKFPLELLPHPDLIERTSEGYALPKAHPKGKTTSYQYYGKKVTVAKDAKKISIIITNLGLDTTTTKRALAMDERFTLAVSPYASHRAGLIQAMRAAGFESWMVLPMQHEDYPIHDYGPLTLLKEESLETNRAVMHRLLATPQERFSRSDHMPILYQGLSGRGLLLALYDKHFAPAKAAEQLMRLRPHIHGGTAPSDPNEVLKQLEAYAQSGNALVTIAAMPHMMDALDGWAATLAEKNIALVPLSMHIAVQ